MDAVPLAGVCGPAPPVVVDTAVLPKLKKLVTPPRVVVAARTQKSVASATTQRTAVPVAMGLVMGNRNMISAWRSGHTVTLDLRLQQLPEWVMVGDAIIGLASRC
jgi:hypothetical protein